LLGACLTSANGEFDTFQKGATFFFDLLTLAPFVQGFHERCVPRPNTPAV
jgi:hypothetical protein